MITITIRQHGLEASGHANYGPYGHDIVCSAVSALTLTLLQGLRDIAEDEVEEITERGHVRLSWGELSSAGRILVDAWFLGICGIRESYGRIEFA